MGETPYPGILRLINKKGHTGCYPVVPLLCPYWGVAVAAA